MLRKTFGSLAIGLMLASCSNAQAPTTSTRDIAKATTANLTHASYHVQDDVVAIKHGDFNVQMGEGTPGDNDSINSKTYGKYVELKTIYANNGTYGNGYGVIDAVPRKPLLFKDVTDITWSSRQFQSAKTGVGSPRITIVVSASPNGTPLSIWGYVSGGADWKDFSADKDSEGTTPEIVFNTEGNRYPYPGVSWDQIQADFGSQYVQDINWVADTPEVTPNDVQQGVPGPDGQAVPMIWDLHSLKIFVDKTPCPNLDDDD